MNYTKPERTIDSSFAEAYNALTEAEHRFQHDVRAGLEVDLASCYKAPTKPVDAKPFVVIGNYEPPF